MDSATVLCSHCRNQEYKFDMARSYGLYSGNLRAAILLLKFRRRERLGWRLGEYLEGDWRVLRETVQSEPVLVPVPLHPSRERERGFNQAYILGRGLSRKLRRISGAPLPRLETQCLRRIRPTPPQAGLSLRARQENVRGVFEVASPERLRDREVVLVDDVMTTGATLSACATVLKRAGAVRVVALTLARATPQFPDGAVSGEMLVDDSSDNRT